MMDWSRVDYFDVFNQLFEWYRNKLIYSFVDLRVSKFL